LFVIIIVPSPTKQPKNQNLGYYSRSAHAPSSLSPSPDDFVTIGAPHHRLVVVMAENPNILQSIVRKPSECSEHSEYSEHSHFFLMFMTTKPMIPSIPSKSMPITELFLNTSPGQPPPHPMHDGAAPQNPDESTS
jgi:hypothetical protein